MLHVSIFRVMTAGLLAVLMSCSLAWAAAPMEKPGPAAEAVDDEPLVVEQIKEKVANQPQRFDLKARANSLNVNASSSFDNDGNLNSRHFRCTVSVQLTSPAADNVVGIRGVRLARVTDQDGAALDLDGLEPVPASNMRPADGNRDFSGYINVNLPEGVMHCEKLGQVEIVLDVVQQIGKRIDVKLPGINDVIGRPVRIEGAGDKPMSLKFTRQENNNHMLYIEGSEEDMARLVDVSAIQPDGSTRNLSMNTHLHNNEPRKYVHVHQLEDGAKLQLQILEGVRIKEHRVVLRELEMPFAPPAAREAKEPLVIRVDEQDAVVAAPAPKPAGHQGELRVRIRAPE